MPYDYAVLDNGQGSGKKPRSAKTKAVRAYLKSKGVKPTKDAALRSPRERKLRAKARAEFASKSKKPAAVNYRFAEGANYYGTDKKPATKKSSPPANWRFKEGANYYGEMSGNKKSTAPKKRTAPKKNKNYNLRYR